MQHNYQDAYLHGQVVGFVLTLPILAERLPALARYLKADRLFALLKKNSQLGNGSDIKQLLKAAQGGSDDLAKNLKQLTRSIPNNLLSLWMIGTMAEETLWVVESS